MNQLWIFVQSYLPKHLVTLWKCSLGASAVKISTLFPFSQRDLLLRTGPLPSEHCSWLCLRPAIVDFCKFLFFHSQWNSFQLGSFIFPHTMCFRVMCILWFQLSNMHFWFFIIGLDYLREENGAKTVFFFHNLQIRGVIIHAEPEVNDKMQVP
jgi:hypothetical protein